jgi:hypothetical protein
MCTSSHRHLIHLLSNIASNNILFGVTKAYGRPAQTFFLCLNALTAVHRIEAMLTFSIIVGKRWENEQKTKIRQL